MVVEVVLYLLETMEGSIPHGRALVAFEISRGRLILEVVERRKVSELVLEKGLLSEQQLNEILRPEVLTRPRRIKL